MSKISEFVIFADDCTLYTSSPYLNNLTSETEQSLNNLGKWSELNKLYVNFKKTKFMVFAYNRNFLLDNIKIKFNQTYIE